ncbi:hypothetical protein GCM10025877_13820 [Agromyces mangrovi Wang et al. 2018]|nr:hypothetical protein GCM10025877_13820 [Agromyces mangrovi]
MRTAASGRYAVRNREVPVSIDEDRRLALNDFAGGGLTPFVYADGPCGIRGVEGATALPSGITLAATFDTELAERYGDVLGAELRAAGCNVLLGPVLDVVRDPHGGRNGECLGEAPLLVGALGGRIARGVHAYGAIAVGKHFAAHDRETLRTGDGPYGARTDARDVRIDERALHEVHLEPFRRAVQDHGVAMLLASYVRVNGEYCSQSPELLRVPRTEWGFAGALMPDFLFAVRDAEAALAAGIDLPAIDLPGPPPLAERTPAMVSAASDELVAGIGAHVRAAADQVGLRPATGESMRRVSVRRRRSTPPRRSPSRGRPCCATTGCCRSRAARASRSSAARRCATGSWWAGRRVSRSTMGGCPTSTRASPPRVSSCRRTRAACPTCRCRPCVPRTAWVSRRW